jgi:glycosyltransferase involved in cell wall biosynthesis
MAPPAQHNSVGVVIPLYNKRAYVSGAVRSVLRQTLRDFALTIVDDGSTDGGLECVGPLLDSRCSIIRTARSGPGAARNTGMRATNTDWVALLDADDEWDPTFLQKTVGAAQAAPASVAIFTDVAVGHQATNAAAGGVIEDYFSARLRWGVAMTSSSVLLHRTTFLAIGGFREELRYADDTEAWFRLSCRGPTYFVPEALCKIGTQDPARSGRTTSSLDRATGLRLLLDSYDTYRRAGLIPRKSARACREFMLQQRGRAALHLVAAGHRAAAIRLLLGGSPPGAAAWREFVIAIVRALAKREFRSDAWTD